MHVYCALLRAVRSHLDAERVCDYAHRGTLQSRAMIGHLQLCLACGWCVLGMLIDCSGITKTVRAVGLGCACCNYQLQVLHTVANIWKVTLK